MKITGTKNAFLRLIDKPGIHEILDVSKPTVSNWKRYIIKGDKGVTENKMEEMLLKAGARMVNDKVWDI